MSGGGTQSSFRKTLGAIKDTTTVSLAKISSNYKELDIAIVRATNHVERPPKEKYIKAIFAAVSATRPRADVAYCIHALAKRLSKTRNWAVALKTLMIIHRALREVDPTFQEELLNFGSSRNHMLNMVHFKDDSSPNAWDYSAWVRTYSLYLEERLECFRLLKYDIEIDRPRTKDLDTQELIQQLPTLQQLLYRVLDCQPQGAAVHNFIIQLALSMVASESIKVYNAICDGTVNLVDKFFEMQRHDAMKALEIYSRAGQQAERLSEFYEACKGLDAGRFPKIEQPPASFLQAMEEYVKEAPRTSTILKDSSVDKKPKVILALEYHKEEVKDVKATLPPPSERPTEPEPVKEKAPVLELPDLLSLDDPVPASSETDEKNAMALAIVPSDASSHPTSSSPNLENGTTGWELALITAPSSNNEGAATASRSAGGLDKVTLDSLYEDAIRRKNQPVSYNPWDATPTSTSMIPLSAQGPFYSSNMMDATHPVQMPAMANQQQAFMWQQQRQQQQQMWQQQQQQQMWQQQQQQMWQQQQQMMAPQQFSHMNPFDNQSRATMQPYGPGMPAQNHNPYPRNM